ncbi:hypothetical protein BV97_04650 [Novosphingobium resinovorum]|uniref:Uncharacterized protein n=1 Tax=Novosphingobium resinovorum TaxID=158500 RepID=A0A031JPX9_9SPHN|nr:hypothetical protein [Novosphingobium resinovorum]EZP74912.1 hypothetical protein BV97_04650 [Novosphingobium resinovorum]
MIHSTLSRAHIDRKMDEAEPHLIPILEAVRDHKVGLMFVGQRGEAFRLPVDRKRSAITIIGDDMHEALGPAGFHMPSVRRIIRASHTFAVISCAALEPVYDAMAFAASTARRNALLIETQPEFEVQWVELIRKLVPGRPLTVATVKGSEGAA